MNKLKDGATLKKVEEAQTPQLPAVKMANVEGNQIEAIRLLNGLLNQKLDNLDKLYETEQRVKAFDPQNPEVKIWLTIEDEDGNKFTTSNPLLISRALNVVNSEVVSVIKAKEAEVIQMAA